MNSDSHSPFLLSSSSLWVQLILVHLVMKARLILKPEKGSLLYSLPVPQDSCGIAEVKIPSLTQPSAVCKQIIVLPWVQGLGWGSAQGMFLKPVEVSVPQELYTFRWPLLLLNSLELYRACSGPTALSQRCRHVPYHPNWTGPGHYMLQQNKH